MSIKATCEVQSYLKRYFVIQILFIFFEIILIAYDRQNIMLMLSPYYKAANELYTPTPQSLFLQSQGAANALILSLSFFLITNCCAKITRTIWSFIIVVFLLDIKNTTGFLLSFFPIAFFCLKQKSFKLKILTLAGIMFLVAEFSGKLFYKLSSDYSRYEEYKLIFSEPIQVFQKLSLTQKIFGLSLSKTVLENTDFGIGTLLIQAGILQSLLFFLFIVLLFWKSIKAVFYNRQAQTRSFGKSILLFLLAANIVQIFSMIHYTVVFQTGGIFLFSFLVAIHLRIIPLLKNNR